MAEAEGERLTTLRYYPLNDKIANESYDDWSYKTKSYIKKKGWSKPFDEPEEPIPTKGRSIC